MFRLDYALQAGNHKTAQPSIEYFYVDFDAADRPHYVSARVKSYTNGSIDSEGGKQFFVFDKRGYAVLVEEMAESFLEPKDPRLLVNQVVDNIKWDDNGVEVSTTTGEMFTADYLLITFSIGVLKSNAVKFTPDLPAKILEPIYKIEMERRGYYPVFQDLEVDAGLPDGSLNVLIITVTGEEAKRIQYQSDKETEAEVMTVLRNIYGKDIPDPIAYIPKMAARPIVLWLLFQQSNWYIA